jgi:hypothetical protein
MTQRGAVLLLAGLLCACDQPPTRELGAAEAAVGAARKEGADVYAADRFREAETALSTARQKADQKDYRGALSAAVDAAEKAKAAATAVPSAKVLLKSAAETAQAEAQAALDEVEAVEQEAAKAKVPDTVFEAQRARLVEVKGALEAVTARLAADDLLGAQHAGAELKAKVGTLAADFRAAFEQWQQEHPKGRKPVRK